jgi:hypothetical protein
MKAYIIQSGHFSKAGNFMGFSAKGEKIHIYKEDIIRLFPQVGIVYRCLGRYEKELVKLPFYCLAEEKTFPYMTHDGQITGQTFTRLTAIEIRDSKYEIKVAAVNNYDYTHPYSSYNNDHLIDEKKKLKWDLEYSQSERERLELLCKKHEETIKNYQHVVNKIKELTSHDLDNLIALA